MFLFQSQFIRESAFVKNCPSQYGVLIVSLFLGEIVVATVSSLALIVVAAKGAARLFLGLLIVPAGYLVAEIVGGSFGESRWDILGMSTLVLSLLAAGASLIESIPWSDKTKEEWKGTFLFVDLPLVLVCSSVVVFRFSYFDYSTNEFNLWMVNNFPRPPYRTPASNAFTQEFLSILKNVFWMGFSAGVITAQLIICQFVSLRIRASAILHGSPDGSNPRTALKTKESDKADGA
ncbi:MAG TPA: hypothetical protein VN950_23540 [Terriglobales bacterium]|nr:hypothetical protein [Terriglobales bacterium]